MTDKPLIGRTLLMSGGSRGIGLAIAKRAARDGANIALVAKTEVPDPRIPGTVYTAAAEIEAAGGRALPIIGDIRDESAVAKAVAQTVDHFGGVDYLVNNASAIALLGYGDLSIKRYDLMLDINARGTFALITSALPHLLRDARVLTLSPPLNPDPKWTLLANSVEPESVRHDRFWGSCMVLMKVGVSLRPRRWDVVPVETVRVARMVFPDGCLAMRLRDVLGPIFADSEFAAAFSGRGQPAMSPALLALVSVLQFAEGLTDRQAAQSVRARIEWKYALGLELTDPGFDFSVLSEFRSRLIAGGLEHRVLDAVLEAARRAGLLKAGGRQRTDSTHVLAAVRDLNRLQFVTETLRAALNTLAVAAPDWLAGVVEPEWFDRYSARSEDTRYPGRWAARAAHANQIGTDGMHLLAAVTAAGAVGWLRQLPAVELLRRIWIQQYQIIDEVVTWRDKKDLPPAAIRYCSPYDDQARTGTKRDASWNGYKVHLTETCEPDAPHLITQVATTPAPVPDMEMTAAIHTRLAERDLLPDVHLVDAGYIDAELLITTKHEHGVQLLGPVKAPTGWQAAHGNGYSLSDFTIDWDNQQATCPRELPRQHGRPAGRRTESR